jgi:hypothetical protein
MVNTSWETWVYAVCEVVGETSEVAHKVRRKNNEPPL